MSKIIIGTSGWIYKDWKGIFYPKDLPQSQWLNFYQLEFEVVEINATFYRFFDAKTFLKWKKNAGKNFKYIIKVPRLITHIKYLKNCTPYIKKFNRAVKLLDNKLALILLQLSPRMPYDLKRLEKAIKVFDDPRKVVVEFRDEKWFTGEAKTLLTRLGCIFCLTDSPKIKLINWTTSSIVYIRLHGRKKWYNYNYSSRELNELEHFIKNLPKKLKKSIFFLIMIIILTL